jgi:hypothetical protein
VASKAQLSDPESITDWTPVDAVEGDVDDDGEGWVPVEPRSPKPGSS